jgi:hypothetical protein
MDYRDLYVSLHIKTALSGGFVIIYKDKAPLIQGSRPRYSS